EPRDADWRTTVILDDGLGELHPPMARDLRRDRFDPADDCRLRPGFERRDRRRSAVRLPAERQGEQEIADRPDPELFETFCIRGTDVGQVRDRRVESAWKNQDRHLRYVPKS